MILNIFLDLDTAQEFLKCNRLKKLFLFETKVETEPWLRLSLGLRLWQSYFWRNINSLQYINPPYNKQKHPRFNFGFNVWHILIYIAQWNDTANILDMVFFSVPNLIHILLLISATNSLGFIIFINKSGDFLNYHWLNIISLFRLLYITITN